MSFTEALLPDQGKNENAINSFWPEPPVTGDF